MELRRLSQAVDELVASDPSGLSDRELHRATVELQRLSSRLAAARARLTSAWDRRRLWADDGSKTPAARLAHECAMDPKTAKIEVKRGRKLRDLPVGAAALGEGRLSVDYFDLLARAHNGELRELLRRDESLLVNLITPMRYSTAKQTVAYWKSSARDETQTPFQDRQTARRHGCCDRTFNGGVHLSAFLPRVAGTVVHDELHRLERQLFEQDLAHARQSHGDEAPLHLARSTAQRMADALALMAARSAGADAIAPPRPLFTILVGYETFAGRVCELEDGTVIEPEELRPYLAHADIERIVFDGPSRVLDVGARSRFFTGATRRAIQVRDRHCTDPSGCDEPLSRCETDHDIEYEDGGLTLQSNGQLHCRHHNRRKHREKRKQRARQRRLERLRHRLATDYDTYGYDSADTG